MKILFKLVSRSRPERFFKTLQNVHSLISDKKNYHVLCTLDLDDQTMNNEEVKKEIESYSNTSIIWGLSKSKIDAFNRDIELYSGWDILCAVSDDMIFTIHGFDQLIREAFVNNAPDLDALMHFPDNDAKHMIPVLYIAGSRYFYRDCFIYNPIYWSVFCDNESMEVAKMRGKYFFMGIQILNHLNPAYGHLPRDEQFNRQQDMWGHDEKLFNIRKANNFGLLI